MTNLIVTPNSITISVGETVAYNLDCTKELGTNTISTVDLTVTDIDGTDVTATYGGGTTNADGVIVFGVKGIAAGTYTVEFVVTCVEILPDNTAEKFNPSVTMYVVD